MIPSRRPRFCDSSLSLFAKKTLSSIRTAIETMKKGRSEMYDRFSWRIWTGDIEKCRTPRSKAAHSKLSEAIR
jgi:hypothetical protein